MMIFRKKQTDKTVQFNTEKVFLAATQPLKLVYGYFCTTPPRTLGGGCGRAA